jgi:opacity protein-like surface antigen
MRSIITASLALLCVSTAAVAQDDSPSYYAGLRGSLAFEGSVNGKANVTPPVSTKASFDVGGGGSMFWGIKLPDGFSAELEMMMRYMSLSKGVVNGTSAKIDGYGEMFAPMVNAYWTAPVDFPVKPYIGGGVGYAWNEIGINSIDTITFPTLHNDDWRFAYNAMAGIVIPAGRGSEYTIGYRWLHENVGVNCGAGVSCSGSLSSQSIDLGYVLKL